MRIFLKHREDQGAVAVIVAISAVVLLGLSAFAVDFGLAYNSKRNLQKGADAASLAAASELIRRAPAGASCSEVKTLYDTNATVRTAVQGVADNYAQANRPGAARQSMEVRCSPDGRRVEVFYAATGSTPAFFGGIFGQNANYETGRQAVADVFVPSSGLGLRPYAICVSDLNALQISNTWVRVEYPSAALSQCADYNGNWYTTDCPLDANNGTLDENTETGCLTEVSIIEPTSPATSVTAADVVAACSNFADSPESCLTSNPGNVAANPVVAQWKLLVNTPGISVPVFNKTWAAWADAGASKCKTGGNNGCFPVQAIAGVKVCGYKWQTKTGYDATQANPSSPCYGVAADIAAASKDNYLWLKLTGLQLTGSSKPATCSVGDEACDGGARGTRLVE